MRLIDADKLETHEQLEPFGNGNYEYVEVVYKDDIDDAPTIEPERKKGKWLEKQVVEGVDPDIPEWQVSKCSVCGKYLTTPYLYYFDEHNFCPYCGADMRGDR